MRGTPSSVSSGLVSGERGLLLQARLATDSEHHGCWRLWRAQVQQVRKEARAVRSGTGGGPRHSFVFTSLNALGVLCGDTLQELKEKHPHRLAEASKAPSPGCKKSRRKAQQAQHDLVPFSLPDGAIPVCACWQAKPRKLAPDATFKLLETHNCPEMCMHAESLRDTVCELDTQLRAVWEDLGRNAMLLVVSLGGYPPYIRWLHELRIKRQQGCSGYPAWGPACEEYYQAQLDRSVCGCLWARVKT
jgi:hypothetical protein